MTEFTEIPVLDLAPLTNGGDKTQLAIDFANAYGNTGFGYIINHGVDPKLRKDIFAASKQFHSPFGSAEAGDRARQEPSRLHRYQYIY
jgi:isopenicillin N synthase-like dioxygenase